MTNQARNLKAYLAALDSKRKPIYIERIVRNSQYHVDIVELRDIIHANVYSDIYGDNPSKIQRSVELGKFDNQSNDDFKKFAQTVLDDFMKSKK
jgi:hypothetical protein